MNPIKAKELRHSWNVFSLEEDYRRRAPTGPSLYTNPVRPRFSRGNEKTIVTSVYNRISIDASSISIRHVQMDEEFRFKSYKDSSLDNCLNVEANIDQTSRSFIQDVIISMLDEGCVVVVPTHTTYDITKTEAYDIDAMRTAKVVDWYPKHVKVLVYNEETGQKQELTLPKSEVAIIENPLYAVMNEYNSTMQRLIRKLSLMDSADEELSSGNLDLIVQLPYAVKTDSKKALAEERRRNIEEQLNGAKYGVAYIDGTEHVTQLNRPIENNLMKQVEYLTNLLYSQLGLTQSILDGTADESTMTNYYNRTIEPILGAISDEFHRKFLTKTARTQKQAIRFFRDPFKLMPVSEIANIADKFSRNEIMSSNEFRGKIGMTPSSDPKADELRNKNISQPKEEQQNQNDEQNIKEDVVVDKSQNDKVINNKPEKSENK
ncbi:hypothetical protein SDC9_59466 [bioreactor metagenome]|uniref:Phage portal protein n=1 Tax=bioreactor metagenome TaxID=1076179 RepID=A0A644XBG6_9ZZZZ